MFLAWITMTIRRLVVMVVVMGAVVGCLPQEVPGLANMEILKIVPKRSPHNTHEPLPPLFPTAADRRYDVMIDYEDYFDDDYGQYEPVDTTLERPQTLLATELSDYVLLPYEFSPHHQGDRTDAFVEKAQAAPPQIFSGQTEELLSPLLVPAHSRDTGSVPGAPGSRFDTTEMTEVQSNMERFVPDARNRFVLPSGERLLSNTEELLPYTGQSLAQDNSEKFPQGTEQIHTSLHHATLTPDHLLLAPDRAAPPLVTEESMQHDTVVVAPPNAFYAPHGPHQRTEVSNLATSPTNTRQRALYHPEHHDSHSQRVYMRRIQHPGQVSLLSAAHKDIYALQGISDRRSSRASYSRALHHPETEPFPPHRSQHSPQSHYDTAGKSDSIASTVEVKDVSHQTVRQDRSSSTLNPSYVRRAEVQFKVKRDRASYERPPADTMSRDERAYYTGLQREIEKSQLLVDAIKDVRSREGKSIKTLRRHNDNHPTAITSPPPDIQEVKKKFGSHPLYRDLPRKDHPAVKAAGPLIHRDLPRKDHPAVKAVGPLIHRDQYSSERDEYEKMYLPVRAKTLELREIRKVKEHFHSLVPHKTKKKAHATAPPRHKPRALPVTTYKPRVISKYIKYHKIHSVTTSKPYYKTPGTSYVKLWRKPVPATQRYSGLTPEHPIEHKPPSGGIPSSTYSHQRPPVISYSRNTPVPTPRRPTPSQHTKTHPLFYPNTHKPLRPSNNTLATHRSSRLYRPQEQPFGAFKSQRPHNSRTQQSFGYQHGGHSSYRTPRLDGKGAGVPPNASGRRPVTEPGSVAYDSAAIGRPTQGKVRRKRGPEMEEYLDAKMTFPKHGYDIDPYFTGFPRFGFFEGGAKKGS